MSDDFQTLNRYFIVVTIGIYHAQTNIRRDPERMKLFLLLSLLLLAILTGCNSMQPLEDQTHKFLDEQPGIASGYETDVKTTRGERIRLKENTARFDTASGESILTGIDKRNDGSKRSIPVSDIHSFSLSRDMAIITRDGIRYEAEQGKWEIIPATNSPWSWHATPPVVMNNLKNRSRDSTLYSDITIPYTAINTIYIARFNALKTVLSTLGWIIFGAAISFIILFLLFIIFVGRGGWN